MKRRFVWTIALVLAIAIGSVGVLQYLLFQAESYRAIDQRLETTASLLLSSDLTTAELKEFEEADDIIEDVIGGERLNQFVLIYNRKGEVAYRSKNAFLLPDELSTKDKWQTLDVEGNYVRILTLPMTLQTHASSKHRMIQVGLIVSEELLRWRAVGQHIAIYGLLIVVLIVLTTVILSQSLLSPLTELAQYLRYLANRFDPKQNLKDLGPPPLLGAMTRGHDEFAQLVQAAESVNATIVEGFKRTQAWTAQMAHELKTPLTILANALDRASNSTHIDECKSNMVEARDELDHLNQLISGFLEWTAAESFSSRGDLHAIRLGTAAREVFNRLQHEHTSRLRLEGDSNHLVFARSGFLQQAISNLLLNALKYSKASEPVILQLTERSLEIIDSGPGIPEDVIERLGQPFNYGEKSSGGFGLGLAWVSTICQKYDWKISIKNEPNFGARVQITFPEV